MVASDWAALTIVCSGPTVLMNAGVRDKRVLVNTCWPDVSMIELCYRSFAVPVELLKTPTLSTIAVGLAQQVLEAPTGSCARALMAAAAQRRTRVVQSVWLSKTKPLEFESQVSSWSPQESRLVLSPLAVCISDWIINV